MTFTPQALGNTVSHLTQLLGANRGKGSKGNFESAIDSETPPRLGVPIITLRDRQTIGRAMFVEEAPEQLLSPRLIEFLHQLGWAEWFARGSGHQEAGREIIGALGDECFRPRFEGNRLLQIEPEKSPAIACAVERLDHGRETFSVCLRPKRSV